MNHRTLRNLTLGAVGIAAIASTPALAGNPTVDWYSIDCGGTTSTGGGFTLAGTIGQFDSGPPALTGPGRSVMGGFRAVITCPADFDASGKLEVADIFAFLNAWFAGDPQADFDGSGGLAVADIFAFLNAWFAGC